MTAENAGFYKLLSFSLRYATDMILHKLKMTTFGVLFIQKLASELRSLNNSLYINHMASKSEHSSYTMLPRCLLQIFSAALSFFFEIHSDPLFGCVKTNEGERNFLSFG